MRFFVVGDVSVDLIYLVDRLPEPGEEVSAKRMLYRPGGAAATVAAQLASLGHTVFLASRVGSGPLSAIALEGLKAAGVDLRYLQEDPEHPTTNVLVFLFPGGERSMVASVGASRYLDAAAFKPRMLDTIDAVIVSAYALVGGPQREYATKAMAAAKKREIPVFIDLGTGAVRQAGPELLPRLLPADYLLMNQGGAPWPHRGGLDQRGAGRAPPGGDRPLDRQGGAARGDRRHPGGGGPGRALRG